ncbi:uncharacterized protein LOC135112786 isoform X1 [Scylla paramamosain]|uniref:uncharacterized protein LOC135112786 isoform X1 n=2 Tax=Scylla paramamosain TaxID=85552 RepID=UPI0030832095
MCGAEDETMRQNHLLNIRSLLLPPPSAVVLLVVEVVLVVCPAPTDAVQAMAGLGTGWREQTDWREEQPATSLRRGPHLLPDLPSTVAVTAGRLATLPCRVTNLKGRSVSWIKHEDLQVLATEEVIITTDQRIKVRAWRAGAVWAWDLLIEETQLADAGVYECQVNTRPKISHPVTLEVYQGGAVIAGPSEVYVEAGS